MKRRSSVVDVPRSSEVIRAHLYDFPKYYDLVFGSDWKAEFELGMDTVKTPDQSATPWAQGEWDIKGTTGFRYLTHPRRFR